LESATYEVFEKDSIKYELYERGLYRAFKDMKEKRKFDQVPAQKPTSLDIFQTKNEEEMAAEEESKEVADMEPIVVMYLGAGRGPLIRRALSAAKSAKVPVKIIAVEKNPNAVITLRNMIADEAISDRVQLFNGDMRFLELEKKGDIIMSELLGSFGDNELSPECLYPTEKFLKPDGIYLPYDYTSFMTPISSQILWNEVYLYSSQGASARIPLSQQMNAFELPYVVKIHSASFPCGKETKPVFQFEHFTKMNKPQHPKDKLKCYEKLSFVV
jgi:protein arginine N-methyltransferase 5